MRALTVKQPSAWAIIHARPVKDVENRSAPVSYRGGLLIHAGLKYDAAAEQRLRDLGIELPDEFEHGGILGRVELVDVVRDSASAFAIPGQWHWILANPQPLPFRPCRGHQHLFTVVDEREAARR